MKKSVKKLSLNKMTISNLSASEMGQKVGGAIPTSSVLFICTKKTWSYDNPGCRTIVCPVKTVTKTP